MERESRRDEGRGWRGAVHESAGEAGPGQAREGWRGPPLGAACAEAVHGEPGAERRSALPRSGDAQNLELSYDLAFLLCFCDQPRILALRDAIGRF